MVKVAGGTGNSADTGYKYKGYDASYKDTVAHNKEYTASNVKPTNHKYEYKSYKPSHVGIYGEKERERVVRPKKEKPVPKPKVRKPVRTLECYRVPRGPDIRTGEMGPDYKAKDYNIGEYKPSTPLKPHAYGGDMVRARSVYIDKEPPKYEIGEAQTYKLDENNYGGMRHMKYGCVDDTVQGFKSDDPPPKEKYMVKPTPKPKPKEEKKPVESKQKPEEPKKKEEPKQEKPKKVKEDTKPRPVVAPIVVPVQTKSEVKPKTFKSTGTQHQPPATKSMPTQTQAVATKTMQTQSMAAQTKSMSIQTDRNSPSPNVVPVVVAAHVGRKTSAKKSTRTASVQCSEPTKAVAARGTQYDAASLRTNNTQTSPMIFAPPVQPVPVVARERTPIQKREETPVYHPPPQRRSPSPQIVPIVAVAAARRSPTPVYRQPSRHSTPPTKRSPTPIETRNSPPPVVVKPDTPVKSAVKTPTPLPPIRTPTPPQKHQTPARSAAGSNWSPSPEPEVAPSPSPVQQLPPVVPIVPLVQRSPTPIKDKTPSPAFKHPSPQPKSPTPALRPTPAVARTKSPKVFISPRVKTPPQSAQAPESEAPAAKSNKTGSRLPPEVMAFIEAYDSAHRPGFNGTVKTVQRTMAL